MPLPLHVVIQEEFVESDDVPIPSSSCIIDEEVDEEIKVIEVDAEEVDRRMQRDQPLSL